MATTWTDRTQPNTTFTGRSEPTTTFSNRAGLSTTFSDRTTPDNKKYLLKEDAFNLLLESGGKIVIYDGSFVDRSALSTSWSNRASI